MSSTESNDLLHLSRQDLETIAPPRSEILRLVEEVFRLKSTGACEMPPKLGISVPNEGSIHAMPAWLPPLGALGCKWVSGFDRNPEKGLPALSGLLILNSPETGLPTAIMDCGWITELRTGVSTAVSAKYLASGASRCVGIIGCGVQGWSNLVALVDARDELASAVAFDIHAVRLEEFVRRASRELGLETAPAKGPEEVVRQAGIIVTATTISEQPRGTIRRDWVEQGSFFASLDYDSCWSSEALSAVDKLYTDDLAQFKHCQEEGYVTSVPGVQGEIGDVVAGKTAGRESDEEVIVAVNLGIGLLDVALGMKMRGLALDAGCGTWLSR